jgi:hypothetical protein
MPITPSDCEIIEEMTAYYADLVVGRDHGSCGGQPGLHGGRTMNRGWLKHGNTPGDPSKARRCGARARTRGNQPCRAPALNADTQRQTALSDARRREHRAADARRTRAQQASAVEARIVFGRGGTEVPAPESGNTRRSMLCSGCDTRRCSQGCAYC